VCGSFEIGDTHSSMAASLALRAVTAGGPGVVQAVGLIPDDDRGDWALMALANGGVGHAAMLRGPGRPIEPADIDLAIRYLPDVRVVIAVDLAAATLRAIADGAAYAGATAIVIVTAGPEAADPTAAGDALPPGALVLAAPTDDPDGTFAGFVAAFAVRIDAGAAPADAWNATLGALAVDSVSPRTGSRDRRSAG